MSDGHKDGLNPGIEYLCQGQNYPEVAKLEQCHMNIYGRKWIDGVYSLTEVKMKNHRNIKVRRKVAKNSIYITYYEIQLVNNTKEWM